MNSNLKLTLIGVIVGLGVPVLLILSAGPRDAGIQQSTLPASVQADGITHAEGNTVVIRRLGCCPMYLTLVTGPDGHDWIVGSGNDGRGCSVVHAEGCTHEDCVAMRQRARGT
jgi:hypothetical protein